MENENIEEVIPAPTIMENIQEVIMSLSVSVIDYNLPPRKQAFKGTISMRALDIQIQSKSKPCKKGKCDLYIYDKREKKWNHSYSFASIKYILRVGNKFTIVGGRANIEFTVKNKEEFGKAGFMMTQKFYRNDTYDLIENYMSLRNIALLYLLNKKLSRKHFGVYGYEAWLNLHANEEVLTAAGCGLEGRAAEDALKNKLQEKWGNAIIRVIKKDIDAYEAKIRRKLNDHETKDTLELVKKYKAKKHCFTGSVAIKYGALKRFTNKFY